MEKKYIQTECPGENCDSSDAFTVYHDGSQCFSCNFTSKTITQATYDKEYREEPCPNCGNHTVFIDEHEEYPELLGFCNHCRIKLNKDGTFKKPLYGKKLEEYIRKNNG